MNVHHDKCLCPNCYETNLIGKEASIVIPPEKQNRPVLFISKDELLNGPIEDRPAYQNKLSAVRAELEKAIKEIKTCSTCHGKGIIEQVDDYCFSCHGSGESLLPQSKLMDIIKKALAILDGES